MTAASSAARGLHCASLLRWVESEEDVYESSWIVNLVLLGHIKGYFTGHLELLTQTAALRICRQIWANDNRIEQTYIVVCKTSYTDISLILVALSSIQPLSNLYSICTHRLIV